MSEQLKKKLIELEKLKNDSLIIYEIYNKIILINLSNNHII